VLEQGEGRVNHAVEAGLQDLRHASLQVLRVLRAYACCLSTLQQSSTATSNKQGCLLPCVSCAIRHLQMPSIECRHLQRGFWRASKRWCKGMSEDAVNKALLRFANNGAHTVAQTLCWSAASLSMICSIPSAVQL
jgi:hypothetical protein